MTPPTAPDSRRIRCILGAAVLAGGGGTPSSASAQPCGQGAWTLRTNAGPTPRLAHGMAYDSGRGRTVIFGGDASSGMGTSLLADTWEWDGAVWAAGAGGGPVARQYHAMAYDSAHQRVILFGGAGGGNFGDTWEWNGTGWNQRAGSGPGPRNSHAMAYDSARGRVVLFGGTNGPRLDDTWEWDGSGWLARPGTGPSARYSHAMAYDSARQRVVLFGGSAAGGNQGDTWEWDGTGWSLRSTTGASARFGHALAYDADRGRCVLFGGGTGGNLLGDTWEWNGAGWTQRSTSGPAIRYGHRMAFDSARGRTVLFGGWNFSLGTRGDTWEWSASDPVSVILHPAGTTVNAGQPASFSLVALGTAPLTYQWRRDGVGLSNAPPYSGVTTGVLTVDPATCAEAGSYDCVVFNGCGGATGDPATLTVQGCCYADCNLDGTLTVADFGCFQTKFVAGDPYADCNTSGSLTVADFGCFQTKFVVGCP